jgi:class 3 adenylate cyclase/alpha-beta hydrolase superfamily lysophospholipase
MAGRDFAAPRVLSGGPAAERETLAVTEVQYARAEDGTHLAYRVLEADGPGDGGRDIVMVPSGLIPMEMFEEEPGIARLLEGLRTIGRVVIFDRRGIGLSDPIVDWDRPVLAQWAEDVTTVIEAAGVDNVVLFTWDGFGIGTRAAGARPELVDLLVMYGPLLATAEGWKSWSEQRIADVRGNLGGTGDLLSQIVPSRADDPSFRAWYERAGRVGASPATAARIWESVFASGTDEQPLDQVATTTLVLHRPAAAYAPEGLASWIASSLPDATIVDLDGVDYWPFIGDVDALVGEIGAFVVGERRLPPPRRTLCAVMFTDLVDSTKRAAALGDEEWKALLDRHDTTLQTSVGRGGGTVVKTTGDGVLATFPSAGVAARTGERLHAELAVHGLEARVGIHVGDVDRRGDDVSGLAVNIAARVMSIADTGQVVVTASVVAAMAGESSVFEPLGPHELKGVPGVWELFRLSG